MSFWDLIFTWQNIPPVYLAGYAIADARSRTKEIAKLFASQMSDFVSIVASVCFTAIMAAIFYFAMEKLGYSSSSSTVIAIAVFASSIIIWIAMGMEVRPHESEASTYNAFVAMLQVALALGAFGACLIEIQEIFERIEERIDHSSPHKIEHANILAHHQYETSPASPEPK